MVKKAIGYITLPDFYVNWSDSSGLGCANDLAKCILKLKKDNIEGLILDLRGNGGGSLKEAVDISGIFIDYGPIIAMKGNTDEVLVLKDFSRGSIYTGPLIVMIDEESASASELVAGVLQDYNKALIVGYNSFGKATSQQVFALDPKKMDFAGIQVEEDPTLGYANITTNILYRVTRSWNQINGVVPDITLPFALNSTKHESERAYPNALIPDSIHKKMPFIPSPKLPVTKIAELSKQRISSEKLFSEYIQFKEQFEAKQLNDTLYHYDLYKELGKRNEWQTLNKAFKKYKDELTLNFTPSSNTYDAEIYATNEVLKMYHDKFMKQINRDIELAETIEIMNDLINNK
jgi:carboxyl-terminal processing protease